MQWSELLNPWAVIRQLRFEKAALEQKCEELWERADEAEAVAFRRASEHWYRRLRIEEEHSRAMLEQMVKIASLQPSGPVMIDGFRVSNSTLWNEAEKAT